MLVFCEVLRLFPKFNSSFLRPPPPSITGEFPLRGVNDVKQTEVHTAEPLEPQTVTFDFEMSIEELKRYTSPLLIKSQQN
jgi:hypothetical protein